MRVGGTGLSCLPSLNILRHHVRLVLATPLYLRGVNCLFSFSFDVVYLNQQVNAVLGLF